MSLVSVPEEIQRKIIVMCENSKAVRNISITTKSLHDLGIQKHFIAKGIEYYFSLDDENCDDRIPMHKAWRLVVWMRCNKLNEDPFVYYCKDLLDNISGIIGDYTIYDSTHEYYRIKKTRHEYKTLGFMNLSEFDRVAYDKNDKLTNIWKNTKWCFVRQYLENGSLTLKALI